jgi:ribosomal protein L11 methyltransferase
MSQSYLAHLSTDAATAQRIMDVLAETLDGHDSAAAIVADKGGRWSVEVTFARRPDTAWLRDLVAHAAGKRAARALTVARLAPRDWVKTSLAGLRPVVAGRFAIHGRHDRARIAPNRTAIEIEAALAFGTGHHGTTRGCLTALDRLAKREKKRRRDPVDSERKGRAPRVLDVGTGSGVLAIAAAKTLRRPVVAGDIDASAVTAAKENVRANASAPLIEVVQAAGLRAPRIRARAPYGLVFANILLAPLQLLAGPIARVLAPGARVVLSGILGDQARAALARYRARGLALECRIRIDDWVTLILVRPMAAGGKIPVHARRGDGPEFQPTSRVLSGRTATGLRSCR